MIKHQNFQGKFCIRTQLNQVSEGKELHLVCSPFQLQIAQASQSQARSPHEELQSMTILGDYH